MNAVINSDMYYTINVCIYLQFCENLCEKEN
jgi:hypothetical protein